MKKLKKIIVCVLSLAIIMTMMPADVSSAYSEPQIVGTSAIIYCGDTQQVIWEKNADTKLPPASMTKLLTCLIAVENLELDHQATITYEAASMPESNIDLQVGEVISVEKLLYGALLPSGNDAANALAIEVAGSIEAFSVMMNEKAESLGCTGSNFVNPSGWGHDNHYSTAGDMALITKAALDNPVVRKIAGTAEYTIPATNMTEERKIVNYNFFIQGVEMEKNGSNFVVEKYDGVFGGKTGTIGDGKNTMCVGLDCDGLEVYCVVMGSSTIAQRYVDMKAILDYAKAEITKYAAFEAGEEFDKVKLLNGAKNKVKAIAADNGYINLPEGASASLVTTKCVYSNSLNAPVAEGQKIGVVEIYIADDLVKTVDLVAAEKIESGWFLSRFGISNLQTVLLGIVLALILISIMVIMCMRISNKRKAEQIRKARLEEEARRQMEREQDKKARNWTF